MEKGTAKCTSVFRTVCYRTNAQSSWNISAIGSTYILLTLVKYRKPGVLFREQSITTDNPVIVTKRRRRMMGWPTPPPPPSRIGWKFGHVGKLSLSPLELHCVRRREVGRFFTRDQTKLVSAIKLLESRTSIGPQADRPKRFLHQQMSPLGKCTRVPVSQSVESEQIE